MIQRRTFLRIVTLAPVGAAVAAAPTLARAQQLGEGMERTGVLDIHNEDERRSFADLQCTCGCPRESIATCTCSFASGFRSEVRAMIARGLTQEEIKAEWVRRYGPQALTVPPNSGANRLLYVAPLALIAIMGGFAVMLLRRFRSESDEKSQTAAPLVAGAERDKYDEKLDEELKQLDDE
jgi:cytochrome c-type biogenesis protein CcmH